LFFIIHIVQVILAGWNNFRSVVSGFEIVYEKNLPATPGKVEEESVQER
jgi:hypothetical protein